MKKYKTWADFAKDWDLVLFNQCTQLVHRDNKSYDEGVIYEWQEKHLENCETEQARYRIEELEDSEDKKEIKERQALISEYGEMPECQCEPAQWYAISCGDSDMEFLNNEYNLDIFYSDILGLHILPVYHFGTAWDYVSI